MKIKKVRSDKGTEFKNANVDTFLDEEGISHEFSATYTPQQNGVVERKNRTLIEMARMMLDEYKTPKHFWAEAVETACHATNRLYLHKLLGKTAYELLTGNKPQVGYFRVFGSKCYILDKLIKGDHILGVKDVIFDKDRLCSACQAGKQVGGSHPVKNIMTTRRPLELLHMDLFGPYAYKSLGGNSFGLVIVDDYSRFT